MGLNRRSAKTGAGPQARKVPVDAPGAQADPVFRACADNCAHRSETDHRIANHLAMLSAYVRMKGADLAKGEPAGDSPLSLFTQSISAQIGSVARLHRLLTTQDANAPVDLPTFLHEVCAPFAVGLDTRLVLVEDLGAGCAAQADQILPIGQLVGEAIVNAAKHACSDSRGGGLLVVRCRRGETGKVHIEVADSGPGLSPAFDPDRDGGFGFRLMRGLSAQLGATLDFRSDGTGLCVALTLPDEAPRTPRPRAGAG
jgi:two-component sensor histidine kinase